MPQEGRDILVDFQILDFYSFNKKSIAMNHENKLKFSELGI